MILDDLKDASAICGVAFGSRMRALVMFVAVGMRSGKALDCGRVRSFHEITSTN